MNKSDWPAAGLEYLGCCPVCSSKERVLQYEKLVDALYSAPGLWTLYQCKECHVCYLDPRPDTKTITLAYSSYHTHGTAGHDVIPCNVLKRIKLALKNGYLNNVWNSSLMPELPLLAKVITQIYPKWMALYDRQAMRDLPKPARGKLLDIGCGSGNFLRLARAVGWSVQGVDFDEKAVTVAREDSIDVKLGGVEVFNDQQELFDVITISHVIEHVHDPKAVLKACWNLLKLGGTFWIEAPNFESYGRKLFGRNWRGLEPPRHLVLFNTISMSKLLAEIGFKNIKHADWMPQHKPMNQASKNIQNGAPIGEINLTLHEKLRISITDCRLKKDILGREFFTFVCNK